jgi:hypothetical protein
MDSHKLDNHAQTRRITIDNSSHNSKEFGHILDRLILIRVPPIMINLLEELNIIPNYHMVQVSLSLSNVRHFHKDIVTQDFELTFIKISTNLRELNKGLI